MKKLMLFIAGFGLLTLASFPASAAFSSLYVFGDSLSAAHDNINPAPGTSSFYGLRWSNGRVWVEVLAQRQGLGTNYFGINPANNLSYYDHGSSNLVKELKNFTAPADVTNDLFIVWVCNADTFDAAQAPDTAAQWTAANNRAQTNHFQIITNLYAKGVRTLIMPNAVDISQIPAFNAGVTYTNVEHNGCLDYNAKFTNAINQALAVCPGLTIYAPDFYSLLNDVLTNAAYYGLTNALSSKGYSIDAFDDTSLHHPLSLTGSGTNYIFWDPQDPTAMFHEIIADIAQQIISPVQVSSITAANGSNQVNVTLNVANMPVGLGGFVDGCTNLPAGGWTMVTNFSSLTTTQSLFVVGPPFVLPDGYTNYSGGGGGGSIDPTNPGTNTVAGPPLPSSAQFYSLRFPFAWNWP